MRSIYLAIPIILVALVLQTAVLPQFPILGYTPQLLLLTAVGWSLVRGVEEGVVWAFFAGLAMDLFSVSPLGSSSLALMAAVFIITTIRGGLPPSTTVLPFLLTGIAIFIYFIIHIPLSRIGGFEVSWEWLGQLPAMSLLNAFLGLPIYALLSLLGRLTEPKRGPEQVI